MTMTPVGSERVTGRGGRVQGKYRLRRKREEKSDYCLQQRAIEAIDVTEGGWESGR